MLKRIFAAVTLLILLNDSSAALLFEGVGYNENQVQVKVKGPKNVSLVNSSRIAALREDYHNLTVDMPSISSELISVFGGGIAVVIVSDGSRYKYHITAPIHRNNNRLSINCVFKSVYDSVDERDFVGSTCAYVSLRKLDIMNLVNEKNLFLYSPDHKWLAKLPLKDCGNRVGFVYGDYYVVRCKPDYSNYANEPVEFLLDQSGTTVFSSVGYRFFPVGENDTFALQAQLHDRAFVFYGSLKCIANGVESSEKKFELVKTKGKGNLIIPLERVNKCFRRNYS